MRDPKRRASVDLISPLAERCYRAPSSTSFVGGHSPSFRWGRERSELAPRQNK